MISHPYRPAYFLANEQLPADFRYPESYKEFSRKGTPMVGAVNEDWCVLDEDEVEVEAMLSYARKLSPQKRLIPFMRRNGEDGVACFDATAQTDDPKVFVFNFSVDVGCNPTNKTFGEWLAQIPPDEEDDT